MLVLKTWIPGTPGHSQGQAHHVDLAVEQHSRDKLVVAMLQATLLVPVIVTGVSFFEPKWQ